MSGQNKKERGVKEPKSSTPVYTKPFFTYRPSRLLSKQEDIKCSPTVDQIGKVHPKTYDHENK